MDSLRYLGIVVTWNAPGSQNACWNHELWALWPQQDLGIESPDREYTEAEEERDTEVELKCKYVSLFSSLLWQALPSVALSLSMILNWYLVLDFHCENKAVSC